MATKIKDDFELQVSRDWVQRFQRVLERYKTLDETEIHPDIREMCVDSTRFLIEKIEREIEGYLAQKASGTAVEQARIHAASAPFENSYGNEAL